MELGRGAAGVSGSAALTLSRLPHYPQEGEVLGEAAGIRAHFQQERWGVPGWQHPQPGVPGRAVLRAWSLK